MNVKKILQILIGMDICISVLPIDYFQTWPFKIVPFIIGLMFILNAFDKLDAFIDSVKKDDFSDE